LLFEYTSHVFIRRRPELAHESALLLIDSALSQTSNRVLRLLGENNVVVFPFPAPTTNLVQALDLVFFGALKRLKPTATGDCDDGSVNDHMTNYCRRMNKRRRPPRSAGRSAWQGWD
jgi:hypothetical protein